MNRLTQDFLHATYSVVAKNSQVLTDVLADVLASNQLPEWERITPGVHIGHHVWVGYDQFSYCITNNQLNQLSGIEQRELFRLVTEYVLHARERARTTCSHCGQTRGKIFSRPPPVVNVPMPEATGWAWSTQF
jgi:hypothetical protein